MHPLRAHPAGTPLMVAEGEGAALDVLEATEDELETTAGALEAEAEDVEDETVLDETGLDEEAASVSTESHLSVHAIGRQ